MQEINLGQITSLVHCRKCGVGIEINPHQESVICKICNTEINLRFDFGLDVAKDK